jgi:hypothetical protein
MVFDLQYYIEVNYEKTSQAFLLLCPAGQGCGRRNHERAKTAGFYDHGIFGPLAKVRPRETDA